MHYTEVIQTKLGAVRGEQMDGYRVFRGLPFAKPPTGERRFQPPLPAECWVGTLDAVKFADAAVQTFNPLGAVQGAVSEDCLYLNVWVPDHEPPSAVFVWIHGGAQMIGATSEAQYDGAAFARSGVVFVSLAYRLGVFGFLKLDHLLGEQASDGNVALQDLVLGLEWIQHNIAAFGGDPERVTLAGQSAGAKCVASVATMPSSKGLMTQLILQSGSGLLVHDVESAEAFTNLYLHELGLEPHQAARLMELRAEELLSGQERLVKSYDNMFPFRPVAGVKSLPDIPQDRFGLKDLSALNVLIGTTRNEFDTMIAMGAVGDQSVDPIPAMCGHLTPAQAETMLTRYHDAFPDLNGKEFKSRFMSAEEYWMPTVRLAERHAAAGGMTYMYRFDWEPTDAKLPTRAGHGIDLPFVFKQVDTPVGNFFTGTTPDRQPLAEQVHSCWVQFTNTGSPEGTDVSWPRYELPERNTLLLNNVSTVASDPDRQERLLWQDFLRDHNLQ